MFGICDSYECCGCTDTESCNYDVNETVEGMPQIIVFHHKHIILMLMVMDSVVQMNNHLFF